MRKDITIEKMIIGGEKVNKSELARQYDCCWITIDKRLNPENLGNFYKRNSQLWFPLDNAAIVYPLGMKFGQMPMFRLSAYLKEKIKPDLLQMALNFTIKRFPSFATTIKTGFFWHYLEHFH